MPVTSPDIEQIHQDNCATFLAAYRAVQQPSGDEQHQRVLTRFVDEGVNVGNFDIMQELFTPDYISHNSMGEQSREEVAATLGALRDALSGFEMSLPVILLQGDYAATLRVVKGTFDRPLPTPNGVIPPNGKSVQVDMVCVLRFNEEGKLAEDWTQFDNLGLLTQLGAIPVPGQ